MMGSKFALTLLTVLWSLSPAARGELRFAQTSVSVAATAEDRTLGAKFSFAVGGDAPVDIVSVTTTCECTTAAVDKTRFAPGEAGVVTVAYKIGASEGAQSQTITLLTAEGAGKSYQLTFKADLPRKAGVSLPPVVSVAPGLLYWTTRKPFEAKTVTVDLAGRRAAKVTAEADGGGFRVSIRDASANGEAERTIEVIPLAATKDARATLTIAVEFEGGKTVTREVRLNVAPR